MERYLREEGGLNADQIARCFEYVLEDSRAAGPGRYLPQGFRVGSFYMMRNG